MITKTIVQVNNIKKLVDLNGDKINFELSSYNFIIKMPPKAKLSDEKKEELYNNWKESEEFKKIVKVQ